MLVGACHTTHGRRKKRFPQLAVLAPHPETPLRRQQQHPCASWATYGEAGRSPDGSRKVAELKQGHTTTHRMQRARMSRRAFADLHPDSH